MSLSVSFILCLVLASVYTAPAENFIEEQPQEMGVRLPRATCDLLSFEINGSSVNHAACAAHCLMLNRGFRGGRCRDGVCHCRK